MVLRFQMLVAAAGLVLLLPSTGNAVDNGLGVRLRLDTPRGMTARRRFTEARIKNVTRTSHKHLLLKVTLNVDEGWLKGRNETTGEIIEDREKFPSGMQALGAWIHNQVVPERARLCVLDCILREEMCSVRRSSIKLREAKDLSVRMLLGLREQAQII